MCEHNCLKAKSEEEAESLIKILPAIYENQGKVPARTLLELNYLTDSFSEERTL